MGEVAPKVFISHAREDKRFVREFAKRLRDSGVDAWLDEWEILPGDKLISKIFEQGIGECDAFVVVLSEASINKPWVLEELEAALVRRIGQKTKIIPILIDDCKVPLALQATAWINIDPNSDYADELKKILSSIFGTSIKPPIRKRPEMFSGVQAVGNYDVNESRILEFIVKGYTTENCFLIGCSKLLEAFPDLSGDVINDAIEILESDGTLTVQPGGGIPPLAFSYVQLHPCGWVRHAPQILGIDVDSDVGHTLAFIVSEGTVSGPTVSEALNLEPVRVNMAVDYLRHHDFVRCLQTMGCAPFSFDTVEATAHGRKVARDYPAPASP